MLHLQLCWQHEHLPQVLLKLIVDIIIIFCCSLNHRFFSWFWESIMCFFSSSESREKETKLLQGKNEIMFEKIFHVNPWQSCITKQQQNQGKSSILHFSMTLQSEYEIYYINNWIKLQTQKIFSVSSTSFCSVQNILWFLHIRISRLQ